MVSIVLHGTPRLWTMAKAWKYIAYMRYRKSQRTTWFVLKLMDGRQATLAEHSQPT